MKIDNLFLPEGYLDAESILNTDYIFNVLVGARGTGKTYGVNKYVYENKKFFIYLRRTGTELDVAVNDDINPFQIYDETIYSKTIANGLKGLYKDDELIGCATALTTFHNLRSVSFARVEIIVYDECIPESHVRLIKNEFNAILNMYETVNRNREIQGGEPCKLVLISNSNNYKHPIITGLGLSDILTESHGVYANDDRSLLVINAVNESFKDKKSKTALYKLTEDNVFFQQMALDNNFNEVQDSDILRKVNLKEYSFVTVAVIESKKLSILRHKSNSYIYVTSEDYGGGSEVYNCDFVENKFNFCQRYSYLIELRLRGLIFFNSQQTKNMFDIIIKK